MLHMSTPSRVLERVAGLYNQLMLHAAGLPNDELFAKMIASQNAGQGTLPSGLGLGAEDYARLLVRHFPGSDLLALLEAEVPSPSVPSFDARLSERQDLITLMSQHRAGRDLSELWMAEVVAAACMGADHLWQDLGLWSRADLNRLLHENFPALAAMNVHDMKWKKFLYKQLCQQAGVYVCRSPSCEVCTDYQNCYGPED